MKDEHFAKDMARHFPGSPSNCCRCRFNGRGQEVCIECATRFPDVAPSNQGQVFESLEAEMEQNGGRADWLLAKSGAGACSRERLTSLSEDVEDRLLSFLVALAEMSGRELLLFHSILRGEAQTVVAKRERVTKQAVNARWRRLCEAFPAARALTAKG